MLRIVTQQSGVNNFHHPSDSERFGLLNGMALSVILLMQLSYDVCIRSASAKLVFLPGCFFAYLLFTYYTSELTAGRQIDWAQRIAAEDDFVLVIVIWHSLTLQ